MKKYLLICLLLIAVTPVFAIEDSVIIPIYRQLFHDKINNEQIQLDKLDGKLDGQIRVSNKSEINLVITDIMTRNINALQIYVEKEGKIKSNNDKIRYLSYIENLLKAFRNGWRSKEFNPVYTPALVTTFEKVLKADVDDVSMAAEIDKTPYQVGDILTRIFKENKGYASSRKSLYVKYAALYPEKILQTIEPYVDEPFADAMVVRSSALNPTAVYNIAQAPNSKLGSFKH